MNARPSILVAGIGNIFLGDDAFGVEVARLLSSRRQPEGVSVVDFGIRGLDLAYALTDHCDAAILVDTAQRGGSPGTLYLIEPSLDPASMAVSAGFDGHSMDPVQVLRLASTFGTLPPRVLVVGCEPASATVEDNDTFELSAPVRAALKPAVEMVESLVARLLSAESPVPIAEGAR